MQTEAIITAAIAVEEESGIEIAPEIMVPLVSMDKEFIFVKKTVTDTAQRCFEKLGDEVEYSVGTMMEIQSCIDSGSACAGSRFLFVWYERFDTDDIWAFKREQ